MAVLLLLHTPPAVRSDKVIGAPLRDTVDAPDIAATTGKACTVTTAVAIQPLARVYVITVVPAATLVTTPEPEIVATDVVLLDQDMPDVTSDKKVLLPPAHTVSVPLIGAGDGCTAMVADRKQPVPSE